LGKCSGLYPVQPLKKSFFGILCLFSPSHLSSLVFYSLLNKSIVLSITLFTLAGTTNAFSQSVQNNNFDKNYQDAYVRLFKAKKYDELFDHLQAWEKKEPNNPEMYIAYFNYFIFRNRISGVSIDKERKGSKTTMEITDPKTGEIVGYINDSVQYNIKDILTAVEYLNKGLNIAPKRLDMHFGKIHILNETGYYEMAGDELYSTLNLSRKINNEWLWTDNENIKDGELFFLNNVQNYYALWINTATEDSYRQLELCAKKQIELYPKNIFAYNIIAVYYSLNGKFQEALKYFLQAEKIDPNDCIVLTNIGRTYFAMDNKQKAKEYFMRVLEIGNEQDKQLSQYYLDKL
jgi:tetratricopeptide (TPR) repeat protein